MVLQESQLQFSSCKQRLYGKEYGGRLSCKKISFSTFSGNNAARFTEMTLPMQQRWHYQCSRDDITNAARFTEMTLPAVLNNCSDGTEVTTTQRYFRASLLKLINEYCKTQC